MALPGRLLPIRSIRVRKAKRFPIAITTELSVAAICSAQSAAADFVTSDGLPFAANLDLLLVSPDLEGTAREICGEDLLLTPVGGVGGSEYGMKYMVVGGGSGFSGKKWAIADSMLLPEKALKLVYITEPTVVVSPETIR